MKNAVVVLTGLLVFVSAVHSVPVAEKPDNNEIRMLRDLADLTDANPPDGDNAIVPSKRYSSGYYTNMKAKYLDSAAMKKLLRMFVGKRTPPASFDDVSSDLTAEENAAAPGLRGYVILTGRLGDRIIHQFLEELHADSQDLLLP